MKNTEEKKHIEKATFAWTDSTLLGILFFMSLPLIILMRFRIGIRILRVEMAFLIMSCLGLIANLSEWVRNLPLIGDRKADFMLWRLFILLFVVMFFIHLIRAFREVKRNKTYTYTRSLGRSRIWLMLKDIPIPLIKKEMDFQLFCEPLIALIVGITLSKLGISNLGTFIGLSSLCLFAVGWNIRSNMLNIKHDANDAAIISNIVVENDSDEANDIAEMASGSDVPKAKSSHNDNDGFI